MKAFQFPNLTFFALLTLSVIYSCHDVVDDDPSNNTQVDNSTDTVIFNAMLANAETHDDESDYLWNESDVKIISFNKTSINTSADGVSIDGAYLTITKEGTYKCSGELTNGQVIVNAEDAVVRIILSGVTIKNSSDACIYIIDAKKTILVLDDSTDNYLSDGASYVNTNTDGEPNSTVFSKDDLTIFGSGSLTIESNYNDAINSKDGLIIASGSYSINSADEGIRGKDYLVVKDGQFSINANGDGIKSDNDDDEGMGYILIQDGNFDIISDGDGIYAYKDILINDAVISITSGGGSSESFSSSSKALKSEQRIIVAGGSYILNAADNAIHSDGSILLNDGDFTISTGNDAIYATTNLTFNGGTYDILESHDGIESNELIINNGTISVIADDDGINIGKETDSTSVVSGTATDYRSITGGYLYINASGHGLKTGNNIDITGGTVIIHGSSATDNYAIMCYGNFNISGGYLLASGSYGMAQAPGDSSSQNTVLVILSSVHSAGELFHIEITNGVSLVTFEPLKSYRTVLFSSSELTIGENYSIYLGGSSTGENTNGIYKYGSYTAGTLYTDFDLSQTITKIGN